MHVLASDCHLPRYWQRYLSRSLASRRLYPSSPRNCAIAAYLSMVTRTGLNFARFNFIWMESTPLYECFTSITSDGMTADLGRNARRRHLLRATDPLRLVLAWYCKWDFTMNLSRLLAINFNTCSVMIQCPSRNLLHIHQREKIRSCVYVSCWWVKPVLPGYWASSVSPLLFISYFRRFETATRASHRFCHTEHVR